MESDWALLPTICQNWAGRRTSDRLRMNAFGSRSLGWWPRFKNDLVAYFGLPVWRDNLAGESRDLGPCEFLLKFSNGVEHQLNGETSADLVLAELPTPEAVDSDSEETIYLIHVKDFCVELEVSPAGKMRRLNLYLIGHSDAYDS